MAQYIQQVAYGLTSPLPKLNPEPVLSQRVPTTGDKGFMLSTIWIVKPTNSIYILASVVNNLANWQLLSTSGSAGSFTTLSSTGSVTLATTGLTSSTIGNTSGFSSVTISAGQAGILLNAPSAVSVGITLNAPFVALPGPVYIYTGMGVPGNGLALHVGDLYINTTAASAATRMYIATAAGTWTNFTTAA